MYFRFIRSSTELDTAACCCGELFSPHSSTLSLPVISAFDFNVGF